MAPPEGSKPAKRRLIVCCDGTWNTPDRYGHTTNVVRLLRSIRSCSAEGLSQIVYYHPGVGTGNIVDHWIGGGTGVGLSENVRSAYAFFVDNYQGGDEIFLFGFSRGAYTARSVAGMLTHVGLLRKHHMENFDEIWDYYRQPEEQRDKEEAEFLRHFPDRVHRDQLVIRCIGVWDTVGALGIPGSHFCQTMYRFHDTNLGPGVEYAFQALAIDEERGPYQPAIWHPSDKPRVRQVVEQVWFPGAHSNIGGGYPEHGLSDATFFWMAGKVAPLLELNRVHFENRGLCRPTIRKSVRTWRLRAELPDYGFQIGRGLDQDYICAQADRRRPYATDALVNTLTASWKLTTGHFVRPLCQTDPGSEYIHESAWMRANQTNGEPVPAPYRDAAFKALLDHKKDRMMPISAYESEILRRIPSTAPELILPRNRRKRSFCDRVVTILGGGPK